MAAKILTKSPPNIRVVKTISFLLAVVMGLVSCAEKPLPRQQLADMPVHVPKPPAPAPKFEPTEPSTPRTYSSPPPEEGPSAGNVLAGAAILGVGAYALGKLFGGGSDSQASGCRNCGSDGVVHGSDPGGSVIMFSAHKCGVCNGRGWLR